MKHTRVVSTKCTPGFACRAFSYTTLVCFIVNEHTTKGSHYNNTYQYFWLSIRDTDRVCISCGLTDVNCNFIPSPLPTISKWWPIVTSWIHQLAASNCVATMTDCSKVVSMDAFFQNGFEVVFYTSVPSFSSFTIERICGVVKCLASGVVSDYASCRENIIMGRGDLECYYLSITLIFN